MIVTSPFRPGAWTRTDVDVARTGWVALEPVVHHPAVVGRLQRRPEDSQLRLADRITAFAGSMAFIYIHLAFFALWMLLLEAEPVADLDPDRVRGEHGVLTARPRRVKHGGSRRRTAG